MPSIARHPRRREGIPKNTSNASTAPLPASAQPPMRGLLMDAVAAVVFTVMVPDPLAVPPVTLIDPLPDAAEHVGRSVAPDGLVVSAHASVTVPL